MNYPPYNMGGQQQQQQWQQAPQQHWAGAAAPSPRPPSQGNYQPYYQGHPFDAPQQQRPGSARPAAGGRPAAHPFELPAQHRQRPPAEAGALAHPFAVDPAAERERMVEEMQQMQISPAEYQRCALSCRTQGAKG